jgi:hypothetical protein
MTTLSLQDPGVSDRSRDSTEGDSHTDLKHAIVDFLAGVSSRSPQSELCPRCGRPMRHLNATFSLHGSDRQWSIPLPVCPCSLSAGSPEQRSAENVS